VKAVALGRRAGRTRALLAKHVVPIDESSDVSATPAIRQAIAALKCDTKHVTISVGGQWVIMRVVEMPILNPNELAQALPIEAQRHVPFNVQDVVLDGAILGHSEARKMWVLIVACKRELLERRISWVQQAGFTPICVDVDALALANAFIDQIDSRKRGGIHAVIDIGAQRTSLVVLKGDIPYLVRDIPWGAVKLFRHMAEQMGLDEAAVSQQVMQSAPIPTELSEAMKRITESLTVDLQLSFDFFENRFGPPPERLLVSGGLSESPHFLEAMKSHFAQPIEPWAPMEGLPGRYSVAYGLALHAVSG
jgi:type IV pilus assembly protein PilM